MDENEICMYIAMNLKKKREQMNLTQEEMAEKLEVKISSYTKIENAIQKPSIKMLCTLANGLHMTVGDLVSGNEEMKREKEIASLFDAIDKEQLETAAQVLKLIASKL